MKAARVKIFTILILGILAAAAALSCGDSPASDEDENPAAQAPVETRPASTSVSTSSLEQAPADGTTPVMPNVDPSEAAAATAAAVAGFNQQTGAGAEPVWGPNIVEGWALMGMADAEGNGYQEMLLHQEGGQWVVKDIGSSLATTWKDRSPAGLWP